MKKTLICTFVFVLSSCTEGKKTTTIVSGGEQNSIPESSLPAQSESANREIEEVEVEEESRIAPPTDGLLSHIDATYADSVSAEFNSVQGIVDLMDSENSYAQDASNSQPQLVTEPVTGAKMLRFDGVDDYLTNEKVHSSVGYILAVYFVESANANELSLGHLFGDYDGGGHLALDYRAGAAQTYSFDGNTLLTGDIWTKNSQSYSGTPVRNYTNAPWAYDELQIDVVKFSEERTFDLTTVGWGGTPLTLGEHHFSGLLGEVLVYSFNTSEDVIKAARDYLMLKWNASAEEEPSL